MPRLRTGLIALFLAGCPPAVPPLAPLPRVAGAPASAARRQALLATLRAEEGRWRTLTIVHAIRLATREQSGSLRGLLAVRRPDAYRLQLLGPAGITAMDLTYRAGRFLLVIPSRNVRRAGDRSTPREDLRGLPVDGLARAFLDRYGGTPADLIEDARWSVMEWRRGDEVRRLWLDRETTLPRVDSTRRAGREEMRITYDRYRAADGARLPFRVHFDMPAEGLRAQIDVERYRVNPDLPDSAFELR
ncbi:MAG: hypothetical protein HYY06_03645 [Deltaproteobacteria bacterium]|nr:hypothetical protein [Deltaproteobacteria bacterium]